MLTNAHVHNHRDKAVAGSKVAQITRLGLSQMPTGRFLPQPDEGSTRLLKDKKTQPVCLMSTLGPLVTNVSTCEFELTECLNGIILPLVMQEISGYEGQIYAATATQRS